MHAADRGAPHSAFRHLLEVRNLDNGLSTQVRINDRGPFVKNRIVDLSLTAARAIGMVGPGTARVELRTIVLGRRRPALRGAGRSVPGAGARRRPGRSPAPRLSGGRPALRRGLAPGAARRTFDDPDEAAALARKLARQGYAALVIATSPAHPPVYRRLLTAGFTAAAGTSPSSAASTMWAVSIAMRSCASLVCAPMCGVATTRGCAVSAWRWVGSSS